MNETEITIFISGSEERNCTRKEIYDVESCKLKIPVLNVAVESLEREAPILLTAITLNEYCVSGCKLVTVYNMTLPSRPHLSKCTSHPVFQFPSIINED